MLSLLTRQLNSFTNGVAELSEKLDSKTLELSRPSVRRSCATTTTPTVDSPGQKKPRYPPLVVEKLPNWAAHFRAIKDKLGRPPNARPYGGGVRFTPDSEEEYRLVQRYLTGLEKDSGVSWFAYSLPAEKSLKIAIRGVPADTDPKEIEEELQTLGYQPEYVRHIKAAHGRPGCVFHAILKKTPDVRAIYDTTTFMLMRGVKIEAWRGKRGPAQYHRCQLFRHSSHQYHRPLACVRCGGEHAARDCPRPREEPATCVNCGGPHPACNIKCPVFQKEIRNKRAGTAAITSTSRRPKVTIERPQEMPKEAQGTTLMAAANGPSDRQATSSGRRKNKRRGGKGKGKKPDPPPATQENPIATPAFSEAQVVNKQQPTASAATAPRVTKELPKKKFQKETSSGTTDAKAATEKSQFTTCAIKLLMDLIKAIRGRMSSWSSWMAWLHY